MSHWRGPRRLGTLSCAHLHIVLSALLRFGGECICRIQLVSLEGNVYRIGGECLLK